MLSSKEQHAIEAELAHYADKEAACIEALKILQQSRGWISDDTVQALAQFLGVSPTQIDGVATFYNRLFRRPVGRHVIVICTSVSCLIEDYARLLEHLTDRLGIHLGETTADGRYTLLPAVCLGACDRAPVMMVDADLHPDLTPAKIDQLLESYL